MAFGSFVVKIPWSPHSVSKSDNLDYGNHHVSSETQTSGWTFGIGRKTFASMFEFQVGSCILLLPK